MSLSMCIFRGRSNRHGSNDDNAGDAVDDAVLNDVQSKQEHERRDSAQHRGDAGNAR